MKNHVFSEPRFFNNKNMIFWKWCYRLSKSMLFEGSGSILEVPRTYQNLKKRALDRWKYAILKKHRKSWIFRKQRERLNLKNDALAAVKHRFTQNANNEKTKNLHILRGWKSCFFVILGPLGEVKKHDILWLFGSMKISIWICYIQQIWASGGGQKSLTIASEKMKKIMKNHKKVRTFEGSVRSGSVAGAMAA